MGDCGVEAKVFNLEPQQVQACELEIDGAREEVQFVN